MSLPNRSEIVSIREVTLESVMGFNPAKQTEWEFYETCPRVFRGTFDQCLEWAAGCKFDWKISHYVFGGYWWDKETQTAYMPT